jgi:hypothetical protein
MPIIKEETIQVLIDRINKLNKNDKPLWGTMTGPQMLAHCATSIKMAYGDIPVKYRIGKFKSAFYKFLIVDLLPFQKFLPAPPEIRVGKKLQLIGDFDTERNQLIGQLNRIKETPNDFVFGPHPIFRHMSGKKWGKLAVKHLDHHLRQFGV